MYLGSQMNRAFAGYRIPSRRVSRTEVLGLQANACKGFIDREICYPGGRFPGCATGSPPSDPDAGNSALLQLNFEFGHTEFFPILTQADLPGEAASCRRRVCAFYSGFFP